MDAYQFVDPVDITGQITSGVYTLMESKKWSERKEALDQIEKITSVPKIQNAPELAELVKILKKTISKDNNIVVVTLAAKCLCQIAQGLRTNFSPYSSSSLSVIFEKFKEKKPNVVSVMRDAADATFVGTDLEHMNEDICQFLDNKNPQIKSEMALFLSRVFCCFPNQVMNKKVIKPLVEALIKTLGDMDVTVRESSAQAIGTAMKVTGEKIMMTLIADVDPLKIAKIKEYCEKAEIKGSESPVIAPDQQIQQTLDPPSKVAVTDEVEEIDTYDILDPVDISRLMAANFYSEIESKKWSERKEALDQIEKITSVPKIQNAPELAELVKILKKTISKDNNIVVVTLAAKCLCQIAQGLRTNFSPYSSSTLPVLFDKFKEKKPNVVTVMRDAVDAAFVGTNLESMSEDICSFLDNKNPQIKSEMALFLSRSFSNYPTQVVNKKVLKPLIEALIKKLNDMDVTVRESSAQAIGTAMKILGEKIMMMFISDVEPIKVTKIKEYCEKAEVKKLPKSFSSSLNNNINPPQTTALPQYNNHPPMPPKSSATMVRSTSGSKLKSKLKMNVKSTGYGQQTATASVSNGTGNKDMAPPPAPSGRQSLGVSSATVKRNATIVRPRGTIPRPSPAVIGGLQKTNQANKTPATNNQQHDFAPQVMSTPIAPTCHAHPAIPITPLAPKFTTACNDAANKEDKENANLDMMCILTKLLTEFHAVSSSPAADLVKNGLIRSLRAYERSTQHGNIPNQ